jgi:hypothetical protein
MESTEANTRIPKTHITGLALTALIGFGLSTEATTFAVLATGIAMLAFVGINVVALTAGYFARKGANMADHGSYHW